MVRTVNTDDKEPEESNFKLPSEKEHLLQVVDFSPVEGEPDVISVKIEVVGGEENGLSLLNRVNINDQWKGFYYTRLFLKAIGEPYKGQFVIDEAKWPGRQFYGTVKHSLSKGKTYANIDTYNFDKRVENLPREKKAEVKAGEEISWDN